jgi:hypothetical protein
MPDPGFRIDRGLLGPAEVASLRAHYDAIHAAGPVPGYFKPAASGDPLARYPRMHHPHRWDARTREVLLDRRLWSAAAALLGEEPCAAQSMYYFKPPGGRGQAMHQDAYYLRSRPGTCLAAWIAIDAADAGNGGLSLVPGTQDLALQCPQPADPAVSFSPEEVPVPPGHAVISPRLEPGDVLWFNGLLLHGSDASRSADRFRRSLILHYVGAGTVAIADHYLPLLTGDGAERRIPVAADGGPCGPREQGLLDQAWAQARSRGDAAVLYAG